MTGFQTSVKTKPKPKVLKRRPGADDQGDDDAAQQQQHAEREELRGAAEQQVLELLLAPRARALAAGIAVVERDVVP